MMRVEENAGKSITGILMDTEKSKDNLNVRLVLKEMDVRKDLHPKNFIDKKSRKKSMNMLLGLILCRPIIEFSVFFRE